MNPCNCRNSGPLAIATKWDVVDRLMAERGIKNDAALAALVGISQSNISKARRSSRPTGSLMLALRAAFPDVRLDVLFALPGAEPEAAAA